LVIITFYYTKAAYRQAVASERATEAVRHATSDANQTNISLSLPFVLPALTEFLLPYPAADREKFYRLHQVWRDFGRSRAEDVIIQWSWGREPFVPKVPYQTAFSHYTMPENSPAGSPAYGLIPKGELDSLSGDEALYIFGKEWYRDVFPKDIFTEGHANHWHYSEYCTVIRHFDPKTLGFEVTACDKHNCYDQTCKK
jgi:hypothetical protein